MSKLALNYQRLRSLDPGNAAAIARSARVQPIHHRRNALPNNIIAVCSHCLHWRQAMPKRKAKGPQRCTKCTTGFLYPFHPELRPWTLLPPGINLTTNNQQFMCRKCYWTLSSYALFGCGCPNRSNDHFGRMCRNCCAVDTGLDALKLALSGEPEYSTRGTASVAAPRRSIIDTPPTVYYDNEPEEEYDEDEDEERDDDY